MENSDTMNQAVALIATELAEILETTPENIMKLAMLNLVIESPNNLAVMYAYYEADLWLDIADDIKMAKSLIEIAIEEGSNGEQEKQE